MNKFKIIFIKLMLLGFSALGLEPKEVTSKLEDHSCYRSAKYSIQIDFSRAHKNFPEIQHLLFDSITTSYTYFIQYGKDTIIEILDPGKDVKPFTCCIRIINFVTKETSYTCVIDRSKTFFTMVDSITYSIHEKKGLVTKLCNTVESDNKCDSINFSMYSTKKDYQIIYKDSIANVPSIKLFYPDVEYLPYKIIGIGENKNTMQLEEVIYGKSSIDSLLHIYDYKGYDQITIDDFTPEDIWRATEVIDRFNAKE